VRLERAVSAAPSKPSAPGFNSTLVRLEPGPRGRCGPERHRFQFHAGAIRTLSPLPVRPGAPRGFNSTLVRLELDVDVTMTVNPMFQFHAGAIRTQQDDRKEGTGRRGFNSTLVRLEPNPPVFHLVLPSRSFNSTLVRLELHMGAKLQSLRPVSIPRWCD